jgi:hypothetical protein
VCSDGEFPLDEDFIEWIDKVESLVMETLKLKILDIPEEKLMILTYFQDHNEGKDPGETAQSIIEGEFIRRNAKAHSDNINIIMPEPVHPPLYYEENEVYDDEYTNIIE